MIMSNEKWKVIPETNGFYEISNYGNVRSWKNNKWGRLKEPRDMSPFEDSKGYKRIDLMDNGDRVVGHVHQLVAQLFIPNTEDKNCVNHIDGNKENNRADNLEWVTVAENNRHASQIGINARGETNGVSKLTENDVKHIRSKYDTGNYTQKELGKIYNVSRTAVGKILNNITWTHV